MAIEVRQMTIKAFVSATSEPESGSGSQPEAERLKEKILSECRQLVLQLMREDRE